MQCSPLLNFIAQTINLNSVKGNNHHLSGKYKLNRTSIMNN